MPLQIDVTRVTSVLLADGWHYITPRSFRIAQFGFEDEGQAITPTLGFVFEKVDQISREHQYFTGPLSSLLAVRHAPETEVVLDGEQEDDADL